MGLSMGIGTAIRMGRNSSYTRRAIGVERVIKLKILAGILIAGLLLVGCGGQGSSEQGGSGSKESCEVKNLPLYDEGVLTVATDKLVYPPCFEGYI